MADIGDSASGRKDAFSPGQSRGISSDAPPKIWPSRIGYLSSTSRNGFSKSLGDLSHLSKSRNGHLRKTVAFEEDLFEQREVLQRAKNRFRELELKYPEIFKDFSRTSSVAALRAKRSASLSQERENPEQSARANHEMDTLQVPSDHKFTAARNSTILTRRAPRLSVAMRSHNLEDSSDSAFDENMEQNMDRESVQSKSSAPEPDASKSRGDRLLNPSDSLESDKDSGISTDRPFIPQTPKSRPVRWAELSADDSTLDLRKVKSLSLQALNAKSASLDGHPRDRRGILKSAAYKNQGNIRAENVDLSGLSERRRFSRQDDSGPEDKTQRRSKGTSIYQRALFQSYLSPDETDDSDAETICSRRSEVILRPNMSARDVYFSTYQLNKIKTSPDESKASRVYKCRSMPELARSSLGSSTEMSSYDADAMHTERKKKKKKKFGRRSGLYVVNDTPAIEKPRRLSVDIPKGRTKMKLFGRKKVKSDPVHINESTKQWFDNRTAVSRPSEGTSLGRIIAMSDGLESAYKLELKRPKDTLYGFFIQKGYKQFRRGVFISRIVDSCSAKFLSGLLNPGDEILEINGENTKHKSIAEVHKIMADSHILFLTVLPYLTRKDW